MGKVRLLGAAGLAVLGMAHAGWAAMAEDEAALQAYLKAHQDPPHSYQIAWADLNGDGRPEAIVRFPDSEYCGTGGCRVEILMRTAKGFRPLGETAISRPPIKMLALRHHGWRDISVFVAGGGIRPGYTARLSFDGRRYPPNPSAPPAEPMSDSPGQVLIDNMTTIRTLKLP